MGKKKTKDKILDAAEKLFASEGYNGTSIRAISKEAGVFLSAVNYHFGSKEALLQAVFERRLLPLNELRIKSLRRVSEEAKAGGRRPDVEDVLKAFIEPMLDFMKSSPAARSIVSIISMTLQDADSTAKKVFFQLMEPVVVEFDKTMGEAIPDMPEDELKIKRLIVIGAVRHVMQASIERHFCDASSRIFPSECTHEEFYEILLRFLRAGMEAK
jgi:AcrR family transcriptional regulator